MERSWCLTTMTREYRVSVAVRTVGIDGSGVRVPIRRAITLIPIDSQKHTRRLGGKPLLTFPDLPRTSREKSPNTAGCRNKRPTF